MNATQFGRWLSERRRSGGWSSQRLLAEAALQHPRLCRAGISEDFLARLEAGHLAYPFRGTVRRRILLLAWLLCKIPRDLKTYRKVAGLNDCSEDEQLQLHLLNEHLSTLQSPPLLLLPARPGRLQGRAEEIEQITRALSSSEIRVFALTGMIGVGKSALAYEVLHRLAATESECPRRFPDGIAAFTCTGRQGTRGLISLLTEITELFAPGTYTTQSKSSQARTRKPTSNDASEPVYAPNGASESPSEPGKAEPELAAIIDRARATLANKRVLLLLDDLDPAFPLRQAVDVLLAQGAQTFHGAKAEHVHERRVILTTSQFVPSPALISARLHLRPLSPEAALALLSELASTDSGELELSFARQACAAVDYLPLAIEGIATALQANGISLSLVATHLMIHPLGGLLDSEAEIIARMEKALATLEPAMRADYLLLAALELSDFDLETAATALMPPLPSLSPQEQSGQVSQRQLASVSVDSGASRTVLLTALDTRVIPEQEQLARLASTAAILGQFVRSSLLELVPGACGNDIHYHMHTLLFHYARTMTGTLASGRLELARHNLQARGLLFNFP